MNEAFCLKELELAAKLGVTHFQIDGELVEGGPSANGADGGNFNTSGITRITGTPYL
ncbi:MAG: hypothetical protein V8T12_00525 [Parabacteroides johnsonii]